MSGTIEPPNTLFPKIGEIGGFIVAYKNYLKSYKGAPGKKPNIVKIIGSIKLHGTHADLVVYYDGTLRIQSRNRLSLDALNDNQDCAKTLLPFHAQILQLRNEFTIRYEQLNGPGSASKEYPIIIAGEWVGPKVQSGVALAQLEKKVFVIFRCNISNAWVPIEKYSDINNEAIGIYNISRGRFRVETINVFKPEDAKKKIMDLTMLVEKECPFSKSFGKIGVGEGIIWKAEHPLGVDPKFWFKSKGELHRNTKTDSLAVDKKARNADAKTKAKLFAQKSLTEMRLKQGLEYLREMGFDKLEIGLEKFQEWLCKDVVEEEKRLLREMKIDHNMLSNSIREIGQAWYKNNT